MHECNQQKNNEIYEYKYTKYGQERKMFRCHLDTIFKFKLLADKLSKMFFGLMISIYEIINKSHAKGLLELSPIVN